MKLDELCQALHAECLGACFRRWIASCSAPDGDAVTQTEHRCCMGVDSPATSPERDTETATVADAQIKELDQDVLHLVAEFLAPRHLGTLSQTCRQCALFLHEARAHCQKLVAVARVVRTHYAPRHRREMQAVGLIAWTTTVPDLGMTRADARTLWLHAPPVWQTELDTHVATYAQEATDEHGRHRVLKLSVDSVVRELWWR